MKRMELRRLFLEKGRIKMSKLQTAIIELVTAVLKNYSQAIFKKKEKSISSHSSLIKMYIWISIINLLDFFFS